MWLWAWLSLALADPALGPGDPAPPLGPVEWLAGGEWSPQGPGKTRIIDFTASWCVPCEVLRPHLVEIAAREAERLEVASIYLYEYDPEDAREHHRAHPSVPHVAIDADNRLKTVYLHASTRSGVPAVYLINSEGIIAWIGLEDGLDEALTDLLAGKLNVADERLFYLAYQRRYNIEGDWFNKLARRDGSTRARARVLKVLDEAERADPQNRSALADWRWPYLSPDAQRAMAVEASVAPIDWPGLVVERGAWRLTEGKPTSENLDVALGLARHLDWRRRGRDIHVIRLLAHVHALRGEFDDAIAAQQRVLTFDRPPTEVEAAQLAIEGYRKGLPSKRP